MGDKIRDLTLAIFVLGSFIGFSYWIRFQVRAELERAGIYRAKRKLTEREMREVTALMTNKKYYRANALFKKYTYDVHVPELEIMFEEEEPTTPPPGMIWIHDHSTGKRHLESWG